MAKEIWIVLPHIQFHAVRTKTVYAVYAENAGPLGKVVIEEGFAGTLGENCRHIWHLSSLRSHNGTWEAICVTKRKPRNSDRVRNIGTREHMEVARLKDEIGKGPLWWTELIPGELQTAAPNAHSTVKDRLPTSGRGLTAFLCESGESEKKHQRQLECCRVGENSWDDVGWMSQRTLEKVSSPAHSAGQTRATKARVLQSSPRHQSSGTSVFSFCLRVFR